MTHARSLLYADEADLAATALEHAGPLGKLTERKARLLLIEDEQKVRTLLEFVLSREGWLVDIAGTGIEGIRRLERSLPDLIMLDIAMPEMDGWAVLARRAAEPAWSEIPVVAMSADHREAETALELGATAFLPKPFTLDELRDTLREFVPRR